jgi:hypothetical protein
MIDLNQVFTFFMALKYRLHVTELISIFTASCEYLNRLG